MVLPNQLIKVVAAKKKEHEKNVDVGINGENREESIEEKNAERAAIEEDNSIFIKIKY